MKNNVMRYAFSLNRPSLIYCGPPHGFCFVVYYEHSTQQTYLQFGATEDKKRDRPSKEDAGDHQEHVSPFLQRALMVHTYKHKPSF